MPHRYQITPLNPAAHLYEVRLTVAVPDPEGQCFRLPAWIPGSYMIRDYARNIVAIRAECDGEAVAIEKLDKSCWRAAAVNGALTVTTEVYAYDQSVRGAHLDKTHAYFNGTCLFFRVEGQAQEPCELDVVPAADGTGADWQVATSMRRNGAKKYGYGAYIADDYDELIDHPFEIAEQTIAGFEAGGIPHAIAIRGRINCDMDRLCADLKTLCETHLSFLGKPADLDRYLFLLYAPGSGYGGLEHRWSTSLVCDRDKLPQPGEEQVSDGYRTFLGLASHEYFHLWNVKRIRPQAFASSELAEEAYTRLLWVFEGITSYYDDLQLLRSDLISRDSYLELIGQIVTRVQRGAGRKRQSVAESSFDAWTKFYKQDENAGNAIVSYYAKGALIALCLDLMLREQTNGDVALDNVMHASWETYGQHAMPEDGFEQLCEQVSGLSLDTFFADYVHGTKELPLGELLTQHGVALQFRAASKSTDSGGKPADESIPVWFGAKLRSVNGFASVMSVENDSPAELAGVAPRDRCVALGGLELTRANLTKRLKEQRPGDKMDLVVLRDDELLTLPIVFQSAPEDIAYLESTDVDETAKQRRLAWLGS